MLLVTAYPADQTADRFAAHARSRGVPCAVVRDWREVDVCVGAGRDGRLAVEVRLAANGAPVAAILNRGAPLVWGDLPDEQFLASEVMASWWAAFGLFPGPVVNRPSRAGFTPALDLLSLVAAAPGLCPPDGWIGTAGAIGAGGAAAQRLRDGTVLGPGAAGELADDAEVCLFTPPERDGTRPLLVAGDRVFDLSWPDGRVAPALSAATVPLVAELRRRQAAFSLVGVRPAGDAVGLAYATAFPAVQQYQHLEAAVHDALLEYLT